MKLLPFIPGILFFLLAVFSAVSSSLAATIEIIYREPIFENEKGKGFHDKTPLTEEEKDFLARHGNDAETLGEARRNAFRYAADLLASKLATDKTIRVASKFYVLAISTQENPCPEVDFVQDIGGGSPAGTIFFLSELEEGDPSASAEEDRIGFGVGYPLSLAEEISGRELNPPGEKFIREGIDLSVSFNNCFPFYYGLSEPEPTNYSDFVSIAIHEMMHGLGFHSNIEGHGHFLLRELKIKKVGYDYTFIPFEPGEVELREVIIRGATIYDMQLYSKMHDELVVNLSDSQRVEAATSADGLLWEGTNGGRNSCSYGQRMAELQPDSAKDQSGKPKLYAPPSSMPFFYLGSSVTHLHQDAEDIMGPYALTPRKMDLALGMLKDMGWEISDEGFPPSCVPTGITVTPTSGLVTTEEGGMASFTVKLDSEPMSDVIIPVRSKEPDEGVSAPRALEFTTENWDVEQTVTVEGVNDNEPDGSRDYVIELGEAQSDDRFYSGFDPQDVTLTNKEEVPDVSVSFDAARATAEEGKAGTTITVTLSTDPERTVAVPITITHGGGATADDYSGVPQNLGFAAGEPSRSFTFTAEDDSVDDDGESVVLGFGALPEGVSAGARDRITVTILDNDESENRNSTPGAMQGSGGGGCAVAAEVEHGAGSAAVNLLLIITVLFSVLFRKSRLTNQPRHCKSR